MNLNDSIYLTQPNSFLSRPILSQLKTAGYQNFSHTLHPEPDLTDRVEVERFFASTHPSYIILTAGLSGGILANQKLPALLIYDNLQTIVNIIDCAYKYGAKKLLYLASSCCYPKHAKQPMSVEQLMTGTLEPTNQAYAMAKLAGIEMCRSYRQQYGFDCISAIPANVFGPGDDFSPQSSHVIPAIIRRMHHARENRDGCISIWGSGQAKREFLFVNDLANACIYLMRDYSSFDPINIGSGNVVSIKSLAELVKNVVGYLGELVFDTTKPDGMPIKVLDSNNLSNLGWIPKFGLQKSLLLTYEWYVTGAPEICANL
jgi:GDP-L-fucose synthase